MKLRKVMKELFCFTMVGVMLLSSTAIVAAADQEPLVVETQIIPESEGYKELQAFLQENLDFPVEFITSSSNYSEQVTKYTTMLASGDSSIDVYNLDEIMEVTFMEAGFLEPIEDVITDEVLSTFQDGYADAFLKKDGHTYAVPNTYEGFLLYANMAMFEEAGVEVPTNLEEMIAAAEAFRKIDKYLFVECWDKNNQLQSAIHQLSYKFGGDYYDWTNPNTIKAVQLMYDMIHTYEMNSIEDLSNDWNTVHEKFMDGQGAMLYSWHSAASMFEAAGLFNDENIVVVPMPTFDTNETITSSWMWAVNKNSTKIDQAKEFVALMATPEAQNLFMKSREMKVLGGNLDAWTADPAIAEDPVFMIDAYESYIESGSFKPRRIESYHAEYIEVMMSALQEYLMDSITLEECTEIVLDYVAELENE